MAQAKVSTPSRSKAAARAVPKSQSPAKAPAKPGLEASSTKRGKTASRPSIAPTAKNVSPLVRVSNEGVTGVGSLTVRKRAEKMLVSLALQASELSIALVGDETIRELNHTYRKKNKPTDVLAFAMEEGPVMKGAANERRLLGDVIISLPTATRQAAENQRSVLAEVTMLLAHGLLHLLGYDHNTDAEERVMTTKTRELERVANN